MRTRKMTLMYLGVPYQSFGPIILFGDKSRLLTQHKPSSHGKLHKHHVVVSLGLRGLGHRTIRPSFVSRKKNPSDVRGKHWAHHDVYPNLILIKPLLFHGGGGDTLNPMKEEEIRVFSAGRITTKPRLFTK